MDITQYLTVTNYNTAINKQNLYIVIHYTANDGDTALNNAKYFYSEYRGASAHYFVDENEIVQVVTDNNVAWHCGTTGTYYNSCRNSSSLGIEMCSRKNIDGLYYIKDEVVAKTIELTKYLMNLYNIPIENVIMHYDVTRKTCPAPFVSNATQWTDFKAQLDEIEITETTQGDDEMFTQEQFNIMYDVKMADLMDNDSSDWSQEARDWAIEKGIVQGTSTTEFNGQWEKPLTREEMAMMMFRFYNLIQQN